MPNKNKRPTKFSVHGSLQSLIDNIKAAGYTEADLTDFRFEMDYSDCYYECDSPSLVAEYKSLEKYVFKAK